MKNVLYPSVRSILYIAISRFFSQDILKFNVVFTVQHWAHALVELKCELPKTAP